MNVVWTYKAETSFNKIVDFLLQRWDVEITTRFVNNVNHTIELIAKNPKMFKISEYDNQSREAFITKHTTMFYRLLDNTIEIEYFWGNFDDPKKLKGILE